MKWATRDLIHFDRVASAWLILRFVDPDAEFLFVPPGTPVPDDANGFGIEGGALPPHDAGGTLFERILTAHGIADPVLELMGRLVAAGVRSVMEPNAPATDQRAFGVLAIAEGMLLRAASDAECLQRSLPLYDALFTRLYAQVALDGEGSPDPLACTLRLASAASRLRRTPGRFDLERLRAALHTAAIDGE